MQTYQQFKTNKSKEWSKLKGIFYAFSDDQFNEGIANIGITKDEVKEKLYNLGGGGYILKSESKDMERMLQNASDELDAILNDKKQLLDALSYELMNHEYCITYDTSDALDALGLNESDIDEDIMRKAKKAALSCM
jgi:hypothetical protein